MRLRIVLACLVLAALAIGCDTTLQNDDAASGRIASTGGKPGKIAGLGPLRSTTTIEVPQTTTTAAPAPQSTTTAAPAPPSTTAAPAPPPVTKAPTTTKAPAPSPPRASGVTHMFFINNGMPNTTYLDQLASVSASWRAAGKGRVLVCDQNLRFLGAGDEGRAYLDHAAEVGIGVVWPLDYANGQDGDGIGAAGFQAMIDAYQDHPALAGWYTLDDTAGSNLTSAWAAEYGRNVLTKPAIGTHIGHTDTSALHTTEVVGTTTLLTDIKQWGPQLDVAGVQWYPINTGDEWGKTLDLLPQVAAQTAAWAPTVGAQPIVATEFGNWGGAAPTQAQLAQAVDAITSNGVKWVGWWELSAGRISDLHAVFG